MSEETIALLPCPFCGGPPVPFVEREGGGPLLERHIDKENGTHADAYVWCHECGAQSRTVDHFDLEQLNLSATVSTIVFDMDSVRNLERVACTLWNDRSLKNLALYAAGYAEGKHLYPRPEWSAPSEPEGR